MIPDYYQVLSFKTSTMSPGLLSMGQSFAKMVLHVHKGRLNELYVPVKYDIDDLVEQRFKGTNPLTF